MGRGQGGTERQRDTEKQRHRDTETQRDRDTETQRQRDTGTEGLGFPRRKMDFPRRKMDWSACLDSGTVGHRDGNLQGGMEREPGRECVWRGRGGSAGEKHCQKCQRERHCQECVRETNVGLFSSPLFFFPSSFSSSRSQAADRNAWQAALGAPVFPTCVLFLPWDDISFEPRGRDRRQHVRAWVARGAAGGGGGIAARGAPATA